MDHSHDEQYGSKPRSLGRSRTGLALIGFLAIAAFFLLSEHRAHALGALPFLLLLLCPLLHRLGHGGHSHGSEKGGKS